MSLVVLAIRLALFFIVIHIHTNTQIHEHTIIRTLVQIQIFTCDQKVFYDFKLAHLTFFLLKIRWNAFLSLRWYSEAALVPSEVSTWPKSSWTRQSQHCRFLEEAAGGDHHLPNLQTWREEGLRNRFEISDWTVHSTFQLRSICYWRYQQTCPESEGWSELKKKNVVSFMLFGFLI